MDITIQNRIGDPPMDMGERAQGHSGKREAEGPGGPKGPSPRGRRGPTRAQPKRAPGGPTRAGPQAPRGSHWIPQGPGTWGATRARPTRAQGGPQGSSPRGPRRPKRARRRRAYIIYYKSKKYEYPMHVSCAHIERGSDSLAFFL